MLRKPPMITNSLLVTFYRKSVLDTGFHPRLRTLSVGTGIFRKCSTTRQDAIAIIEAACRKIEAANISDFIEQLADDERADSEADLSQDFKAT